MERARVVRVRVGSPRWSTEAPNHGGRTKRSFDLVAAAVGDVDPGHWRRLTTHLTEAALSYPRLGRNKRGDGMTWRKSSGYNETETP